VKRSSRRVTQGFGAASNPAQRHDGCGGGTEDWGGGLGPILAGRVAVAAPVAAMDDSSSYTPKHYLSCCLQRGGQGRLQSVSLFRWIERPVMARCVGVAGLVLE
jgi:hypothetical protein